VAFALLSAVCLSLSFETAWVVFIPVLILLLIVGCGLIVLAMTRSAAAVTVVFAVLLFMTDANFRVRAPGDLTTLDWQGVLKFGVWLVCGLVGLAYLPSPRMLLGRLGSALWLGYIVVAGLSVFLAPSPVFSFGYVLSLLCIYMFTFALIEMLSEPQILWTITLTLAIFLIVSWVVFYIAPTVGQMKDATANGFELRMSGIAGQPNLLGTLCSTYVGAVFLLLWKRYSGMIVAAFFAAPGIVTLIATDSRTAFAALAVGVSAVIFSRSIWRISAIGLVATFGLLGSFVVPMKLGGALSKLVSRSGDTAELGQLTGRTQIWEFTWQKISERPFFGWGYGSSKVIFSRLLDLPWGLKIDQAHNLLLQNLFSVGLIGTLPLVGLLLKFLVDIAHGDPAPLNVLFLVIVFVTGIADGTTLGSAPTVLTLMFMLASLWPEASFEPAQVASTSSQRMQSRPGDGIRLEQRGSSPPFRAWRRRP